LETIMTKVKNISTGPRGAWLGRQLVMVEPGQIIDADDFAPEWFRAEKASAAKPAGDIKAALGKLDADNDDHWTAAGLPAVDAVSELVGHTVTRAQIEEAGADFVRPDRD